MDCYSIQLLLFFATLMFLWITWRKRKFTIFSEYGIVGPKPNFLNGNLTDMIQNRETFDTINHRKYGSIFGYFYGTRPFISVADPDLLKTIQVKELKVFSNRNFLIPNFGIPHPIVAESFGIKKDEEWKQRRSILTPSFSSGRIKQMSQIMNDAIDEFLPIINQKSNNAEYFDIFPFYKKLTLDVISRTAFGIDTGVQGGKNSLFVESMRQIIAADSTNILNFLSVCFPELEPVPTKLAQIRDAIKGILGYPAVKVVFDVCQDIIEQRKKSGQKRKDLLQSMMDEKIDYKKIMATKYEDLDATVENVKEEEPQYNDSDSNVLQLTTDEIKANALVLMAAGYDTTSSCLGFVTSMLSIHQDVQDKVRNELMTIIGKQEEIKYEDLSKLQYLDQVLAEVLRLYPLSSVVINRECKEDFKYKTITIPKGVTVTVPIWKFHRDPNIWSEPDKFIPERFSPENKGSVNSTIYQPFGNGPRNCIGLRFAQVTIKLVLARLLLSFKLECSSKEEFKHYFTLFVIRPERVVVRAVPI